jgi:hypothetical protein
MTDPLSRADLALKAADEFFDLARKAPTPFMRAYYERVALRLAKLKRTSAKMLGACSAMY